MLPRRVVALAAGLGLLPALLTTPALAEPAEPSAPTTAISSPAAEADPSSQPTEAPQPVDPDEALDVARSVLVDEADGSAAESPSIPVDGTSATVALRDLAVTARRLDAADRQEAQALLARPAMGDNDPLGNGYAPGVDVETECSVTACVHWVESTRDAVSLVDADRNGIPDYVDLTLRTVDEVHRTYMAAGYRPPLGDGNRGGDSRVDFYLADIGDQRLFGYCATDEILAPSQRTAPAYCVLDNDYARSQFPQNTPTENLQISVAHEYFHAVQFAYDVREDAWLLEGTAAWMEDQVYPVIKDNLRYLRTSPMTQPRVPMDLDNGLHPYGAWIFFRWLSERFPATEGGIPTVVRDIWRRADATPGAPDAFSLQAVAQVTRARGLELPVAFARFAEANRSPGRSYRSGGADSYPRTPVTQRTVLGRGQSVRPIDRLDHLTSSTRAFVPARGARAPQRLKLTFRVPPRQTGSAVIIRVFPQQGGPRSWRVALPRNGNTVARTNFNPREIRRVEVTMVNASQRFQRCGTNWPHSCGGRPVDSGRAFAVRAQAQG